MKAMILHLFASLEQHPEPLKLVEIPGPLPGTGEILLRVTVCGVCHTELDEIEGRTPPPRLPVIPGHQVIGRIEKRGPGANRFSIGDRVGVGWIFSACGRCEHCRRGEENLCPEFAATGRDANGGYAEFMVVPEAFAHTIPDIFSDIEAAPLLCAGAIGYRSLRLAGPFNTLGLTGFGASGHLVLKMAMHQNPRAQVYVFARSKSEQTFALELGATWAGDTEDNPGVGLDAIIDTTPVWKPMVSALAVLRPGGRLVVNAIRKEESDKAELLKLDYPKHLWMEKEVRSVANVTRQDIAEFLSLAAKAPIRPEVKEYRLEDANQALADLKARRIRGAKVLIVG